LGGASAADAWAMTRITDPLREEHNGMRPRVEELQTLADRIDQLNTPRLEADLDRALAFLTEDLIPHAMAEDEVLYPAVALFLGGPDSTATMSRDHLEIDRLVLALRRVRAELPSGGGRVRHEIRRLLYALHAVTVLHLAKEEEIYFPV